VIFLHFITPISINQLFTVIFLRQLFPEITLAKLFIPWYAIQNPKRRMCMRLQESGEMYLETIYVLSQKMNIVRAIDVSEDLGYSKPSVSRAVSLLKQGGYLTVEDTGNLRLSQTGLEIAEKIYARHTLLKTMLIR
jgi:DNA-binding transcriptional ArsR family regulator